MWSEVKIILPALVAEVFESLLLSATCCDDYHVSALFSQKHDPLMMRHKSLPRLTVDATEGLLRLTSGGLCRRLSRVRCCSPPPAVYRPPLGPARGWDPLRWSQELWGRDCHRPARGEGCSGPGSLRCRYFLWSQGGACPRQLRPA